MARTATWKPPRRDAGSGSIYWNTHQQYWEAKYQTGKNPDGKPEWRYAPRVRTPGKVGYREAEALLEALIKEITKDRDAQVFANDPRNYTLWQAIEDWYAWVPSQPRTSQQTADKLYSQMELHAKDAIGGTPLWQLDVELLSNWFESIAGNLALGSLGDIRGTLRRVCAYAMRQKSRTGFSGPNPVTDVEMPEAGNAPRDKDFLDKRQVEAVLTANEGTPMYALMMTGFMLGLRPGELRALKWEHADLKEGVLYVLKYARKTGDGETKTRLSRRAIRLPRRLLAALTDHQKRWGGRDYVFTMDDGTQLKPYNMRWRIRVAFRNAGFSISNPYALRHTFASISYDEGMPSRDIAQAMGHSNELTFKRVYAHWLRPEVTEVAEVMNTIWGDGEVA